MGFLMGHSAWQIDQFPTCWPMNGLFVHWSRGWGVSSFSERLVHNGNPCFWKDGLLKRMGPCFHLLKTMKIIYREYSEHCIKREISSAPFLIPEQCAADDFSPVKLHYILCDWETCVWFLFACRVQLCLVWYTYVYSSILIIILLASLVQQISVLITMVTSRAECKTAVSPVL